MEAAKIPILKKLRILWKQFDSLFFSTLEIIFVFFVAENNFVKVLIQDL